MTEKQKQRIRNYKNSEGLARAYYYVVIALTMGNVEAAVEQYEREQTSDNPVISEFARTEQANERNAGFSVVYGTRRHKPQRYNEDDDDGASLSDILVAEAAYSALSDDSPNSNETSGFAGFGGDGDFGGGGAGGSWGSDSY